MHYLLSTSLLVLCAVFVIQACPSQPGPRGTDGKDGNKGPPGPEGPRGPQGAMGDAGVQGIQEQKVYVGLEDSKDRQEDTRGQNCPSETEGKGQEIPQFFPLAQVWFTILLLPPWKVNGRGHLAPCTLYVYGYIYNVFSEFFAIFPSAG